MLSKTLCGTATADLLWYKLLTETLIKEGFQLNPHDLCVVNKMVDDKQCTIIYHVDDTKILHMSTLVLGSVLNLIESNFGKLKIMRGKQYEFLGMKITHQDDGCFHMNMRP